MPRKLIALCMLIAGTVPASAQDGNAIVKKVTATYLGLTSYSHKSSSTDYRRGMGVNSTSGSTASVLFRKPNLLVVTVSSPEISDINFYSDGRDLVVYSSKLNQYIKGKAAATVSETFAQLNKLCASNFGPMISAICDPLALIQGIPLPSGASWVAQKTPANLDGAQCWIVEGTIAVPKQVSGSSAKVSLWIEKDTNLIRKVVTAINRVPGIIPVRSVKNGKTVVEPRRITIDRTISERIQERSANPPLDANAFRFTPPKGAIERKVQAPTGK